MSEVGIDKFGREIRDSGLEERTAPCRWWITKAVDGDEGQAESQSQEEGRRQSADAPRCIPAIRFSWLPWRQVLKNTLHPIVDIGGGHTDRPVLVLEHPRRAVFEPVVERSHVPGGASGRQ